MDDKDAVARPELARWILVALVIVAGIVLFFIFAPGIPPAITPGATGGGP